MASVADSTSPPRGRTYDGPITLDRRTFLLAASASAAAAVVGRGEAVLAAPPPGACAYVPKLAPRMCDTRFPLPAHVTRRDSRTVRITATGYGGVPANATAVAVSLSCIRPVSGGYATAWPSGQPRPLVANLNAPTNGVVQTMAVVSLGADGAFDVFTSQLAHVTVDLLGSFEPVATDVSAGRYVPMPAPTRVLDTRTSAPLAANSIRVLDTSAVVPAHASAVVVSLTAVSSAAGFLVVHQEGTPRPDSAHLNCDAPWQTRGSQTVVPFWGPNRRIAVYTSGGGHVLVDVVGYITGASSPPGGDGLFVPATVPTRQLNSNQAGGLGNMYPGWIAEAPLPVGVTASAAAWNVALVGARQPGALTAYPARTAAPRVGHVYANASGATLSSHSWSRVSTLGLAVTTTSGGAVIADYAGYFTGPPALKTVAAPVNVMPTFPPPPYTLSVPRIGLTLYSALGGTWLADAGHGWVWPSSVNAGDRGAVVIFAHRTDAGGPFRYINLIRPGDEMVLTAAGGKRFVYRMQAAAITGSSESSILRAVDAAPVPSLSLVACSKTDGTPTSLLYRLVVTGTLEYPIIP